MMRGLWPLKPERCRSRCAPQLLEGELLPRRAFKLDKPWLGRGCKRGRACSSLRVDPRPQRPRFKQRFSQSGASVGVVILRLTPTMGEPVAYRLHNSVGPVAQVELPSRDRKDRPPKRLQRHLAIRILGARNIFVRMRLLSEYLDNDARPRVGMGPAEVSLAVPMIVRSTQLGGNGNAHVERGLGQPLSAQGARQCEQLKRQGFERGSRALGSEEDDALKPPGSVAT